MVNTNSIQHQRQYMRPQLIILLPLGYRFHLQIPDLIDVEVHDNLHEQGVLDDLEVHFVDVDYFLKGFALVLDVFLGVGGLYHIQSQKPKIKHLLNHPLLLHHIHTQLLQT